LASHIEGIEVVVDFEIWKAHIKAKRGRGKKNPCTPEGKKRCRKIKHTMRKLVAIYGGLGSGTWKRAEMCCFLVFLVFHSSLKRTLDVCLLEEKKNPYISGGSKM